MDLDKLIDDYVSQKSGVSGFFYSVGGYLGTDSVKYIDIVISDAVKGGGGGGYADFTSIKALLRFVKELNSSPVIQALNIVIYPVYGSSESHAQALEIQSELKGMRKVRTCRVHVGTE